MLETLLDALAYMIYDAIGGDEGNGNVEHYYFTVNSYFILWQFV